MSLKSSPKNYYPALDGLRGLAILLVVFYHNFGFIRYFFFGWIGVDLFFVLSGFLITEILLNTRFQPKFLKHFYFRRILRIFPLYYLALFIFLVLVPLFISVPSINYFIQHQFWFWLYLQNWLFIFINPGDHLLLTHLWSLAVEEQFYLFWPFAMLLVKSAKRLFYLMFALLISVLALRFFIWAAQLQNFSYFNLFTFTRIDGICIGSMLALLRAFNINLLERWKPFIALSLAAFNFLIFFLNNKMQAQLPFLAIAGYTTFAFLLALLVNEAIEGTNKIVNFVFNLRPLKFFSHISYSLYVFHWPLHLLLFRHLNLYLTAHLSDPRAAQVLSSTITTTIAIFISMLSYRYFESYFLRLKKNFS